MPTVLARTDQMTIEAFLAFYDTRPDGEKWELIDGFPVMSASPTQWHRRWRFRWRSGRFCWRPTLPIVSRCQLGRRKLAIMRSQLCCGAPRKHLRRIAIRSGSLTCISLTAACWTILGSPRSA